MFEVSAEVVAKRKHLLSLLWREHKRFETTIILPKLLSDMFESSPIGLKSGQFSSELIFNDQSQFFPNHMASMNESQPTSPFIHTSKLEPFMHDIGHILELEPHEFFRLRIRNLGMANHRMRGLVQRKKIKRKTTKVRELGACALEFIIGCELEYNFTTTDWEIMRRSVYPPHTDGARMKAFVKEVETYASERYGDFQILPEWNRRMRYINQRWQAPATALRLCDY